MKNRKTINLGEILLIPSMLFLGFTVGQYTETKIIRKNMINFLQTKEGALWVKKLSKAVECGV